MLNLKKNTGAKLAVVLAALATATGVLAVVHASPLANVTDAETAANSAAITNGSATKSGQTVQSQTQRVTRGRTRTRAS